MGWVGFGKYGKLEGFPNQMKAVTLLYILLCSYQFVSLRKMVGKKDNKLRRSNVRWQFSIYIYTLIERK